MDKTQLRKIYSSKEIIDESKNRTIVGSAADFIDKYHNIKLIGIYLPLTGEIDLSPLITEFSDRKFAIPKIKDTNIYFTNYQSGDPLQLNKGFPGYYEPVSNLEVIPEIIFVPGIAFDIKGYRLGRGKGHYDRYLAKHNITRIGVTLSSNLLLNLPNEPHDFKMNYIITEDMILDICSP
jgi:5-formyltetrahydrofolate cyclo-ligase